MAGKEDILDNVNIHEILLMISDKAHNQPDNKQYVFNKINDFINSDGSSQESYASRLLKRISTNLCDINQPNDEKNTPLHFACQANDTDTIAFLLSDKRLTTLNSKNLVGETPLMMAVDMGNVSSVEVMIEAKGGASSYN